ncbi:PREDICTED: chaperone protein dnaJ 20, chloroplastic-like [Fragaria vesca subsp. vesca]|uniref:chaperone protein dnaJ 20, chloroplastic-like n=1 Tax=Fragaria vesca subsp. vesca TaxID=101020 RepID=UPI0002C333D3|nr:PREDICTED: chaperone protein dnaJ 20, chloroplastic-like [Fragaria vesca subsp. vesca]
MNMEISFQITNPKLEKMVSMPSNQKAYISCRSHGGLAMHKKNKASNFYDLLSLGSENNNKVGLHEIKKAYRNMALQLHPDVVPPSAKEESTRRFIELQKAYETLSDPVSRQIYDYQLGLGISSVGWGVDESCMDQVNRSMFSKEVWEEQLRGLHKRSQTRTGRKHYRPM